MDRVFRALLVSLVGVRSVVGGGLSTWELIQIVRIQSNTR